MTSKKVLLDWKIASYNMIKRSIIAPCNLVLLEAKDLERDQSRNHKSLKTIKKLLRFWNRMQIIKIRLNWWQTSTEIISTWKLKKGNKKKMNLKAILNHSPGLQVKIKQFGCEINLQFKKIWGLQQQIKVECIMQEWNSYRRAPSPKRIQ